MALLEQEMQEAHQNLHRLSADVKELALSLAQAKVSMDNNRQEWKAAFKELLPAQISAAHGNQSVIVNRTAPVYACRTGHLKRSSNNECMLGLPRVCHLFRTATVPRTLVPVDSCRAAVSLLNRSWPLSLNELTSALMQYGGGGAAVHDGLSPLTRPPRCNPTVSTPFFY